MKKQKYHYVNTLTGEVTFTIRDVINTSIFNLKHYRIFGFYWRRHRVE